MTYGATVTAPDGRTFIQGDTSTYLRTTLDPIQRPSQYRQDYGPRGVARQSTGEAIGHIVTPSSPRTDYLGFRLVLRIESECARFWYITYEDEAGERYETRRLRGSIEGNG